MMLPLRFSGARAVPATTPVLQRAVAPQPAAARRPAVPALPAAGALTALVLRRRARVVRCAEEEAKMVVSEAKDEELEELEMVNLRTSGIF